MAEKDARCQAGAILCGCEQKAAAGIKEIRLGKVQYSSARQSSSSNFRDTTFLLMQEHPEYATLTSTLRHLVRTQGLSGLWAGIVPRAGRISCAVIILQGVRSKLISLVEQMKSAS